MLASAPMLGAALKSVRAVFPDAELYIISQRAAVGVGGVGGWLAIRWGRGSIVARECFGTWYAPLRALRSAGVHTSYALTLDELQAPNALHELHSSRCSTRAEHSSGARRAVGRCCCKHR